ncbi:MAG TPA: glycosyl hydrolase [Bacillota bacterium]|nr:glycosyl hydrolase [Bacillota bacterium]
MRERLTKRCFLGVILIGFTILICGCGGGGGGSQDPSGQPGVITISNSNPQDIPATFYGQNYWDWAYTGLAGTESIMDELRLNVYRAGGTCNDWHNDGHAWGKPEVDQYIAYCRAIHAEPLLSVSVIDGTPEQAAEMVRYCNVERGYNVKYWIIGNEPEYYVRKIAGYNVNSYSADFINFVKAMKAVDSEIKVIGPEVGGEGMSWIASFLGQCKDYVDIVSFHHYPFGNSGDFTINNVMGDNDSTRQKIRQVRNTIDTVCGSYKPLAITEIHTSWSDVMNEPASAETFYSGLWIANNIGVGLQERLWSMDLWGTNGGYGTGFLNPDKTPRPSYYAMQMFTTHFGKRLIPAESILGVPAYASRNREGTRTVLIVVNKKSNPQDVTIKFAGFVTAIPGRAYSFPPYSLTCLSIPDDGGPMECWSYTKDLADRHQPPSYQSIP